MKENDHYPQGKNFTYLRNSQSKCTNDDIRNGKCKEKLQETKAFLGGGSDFRVQ